MQNIDRVQSRKVAIVTGAARRIGAVIAGTLHKEGFNVLVHYRSSGTEAQQLVDELNGLSANTATSHCADLCDEESASQLVDLAIEKWGRVDLLVNNASVFFPTPVGKITADAIGKLFATNVQAPLLLAQAACPHLRKNKGSIINIVDIYSSIAHKDHSAYCASKAALNMLTRSLATDLAPDVRVNGVSPGAILWPETGEPLPDDIKNDLLAKIPLNRKGNADDISGAVLYLANAEYVTGHIINVDGGRSL